MTLHQYRKKKINDYLFDHKILRNLLDNLYPLLLSIVAAIVFSFGFSAFITPYSTSSSSVTGLTISTGGCSGISQDLALFVKVAFHHEIPNNILQAIGYTVFNIPILLFGFFKVGKKFSVYSLINVALSSLLIWVFSFTGIGERIGESAIMASSNLTRAVFSGVCVGLSSAIAFKGDLSCGGIDVVSYYLSVKKSTSVGKFAAAINAVIIGIYAVLSILDDPSHWESGIMTIFYSLVYVFVATLIIDAINLRNKKIRLEIITGQANLPEILMANFPHGCTIMKGTGAYTGQDRLVLICIVSSNEVKQAVRIVHAVDPHSFISVTELVQVYGSFFIKPVE